MRLLIHVCSKGVHETEANAEMGIQGDFQENGVVIILLGAVVFLLRKHETV